MRTLSTPDGALPMATSLTSQPVGPLNFDQSPPGSPTPTSARVTAPVAAHAGAHRPARPPAAAAAPPAAARRRNALRLTTALSCSLARTLLAGRRRLAFPAPRRRMVSPEPRRSQPPQCPRRGQDLGLGRDRRVDALDVGPAHDAFPIDRWRHRARLLQEHERQTRVPVRNVIGPTFSIL